MAVQVSLTQDASEVAGHEMGERPAMGSVTVTGSSVTLPVLVTLTGRSQACPGPRTI